MSNVSEPADPGGAILADLVAAGFPVDTKPYCVMAARLGLLEGDVLESVLGMRMDGTIERVGATFAGDRCSELSEDELALVDLLAGDLPTGEDPYAELAAELERQGLDVDEDWVLDRMGSWLASGIIAEVGVTVAPGETI